MQVPSMDDDVFMLDDEIELLLQRPAIAEALVPGHSSNVIEKPYLDQLPNCSQMNFDDYLYGQKDFDQKFLPCEHQRQQFLEPKHELFDASAFEHDFGHIKTEPISPGPICTRSFSEPVPDIPNSPNSSIFPEFDQASLEIYRDLILRHLLQDITATCANLAIPSDPMQWTPQQSALWLQDMVLQFQLEASPSRLFLPGRMLCAMTQEQFAAEAPGGGETLHAQLQIWKTAVEFAAGHQSSPLPTQPTAIEQPAPQTNEHKAMTLQDWLSSFDPHTGLTSEPNASPSSYGSGYGSSYAGSQYNRSMSLANEQQMQPSPASDSGISSGEAPEYELFENSPICAPVKARRATLPGAGPSTGSIHLWQFLRELLDSPDNFGSCVRWLDRKQGIFKIENSHQLAKLWGQRKNRTKMNYDKLSRSLRQYYKKNIIRKTGQRQRLIYQFTPPYNFS